MTTETPADDGRSMYQRMIDGDEYIAEGPEIAAGGKRAFELQNAYLRASVDEPELAHAILDDLGEGAYVKPPLFVDYGSNITIGAGTFVNYNLTALDVGPIRIGADCQIGPNVQLLTPSHPLDAVRRREKWESSGPIAIGDNVWLGGGVIVLGGVTIGDNTVVGSGAVVTKDLPANVVAVGNPARVVRELDPPADRA